MSRVPLNGIDFLEYADSSPERLVSLFENMGFVKRASHKQKEVQLFSHGDCQFVINNQKSSFAEDFSKKRGGPCVSSMGFRVKIPAKEALEILKAKGAREVEKDDYSHSFPAIYGVGGSLIYLIDDFKEGENHWTKTFDFKNELPKNQDFFFIDHLTNNVAVGEMDKWCEFYEALFDFSERRYFDIKGKKTGLVSKVMRSPCDTVTIPINQPSEDEAGKKSQIQEYLDEYSGAGIQHIALSTKNIIASVDKLSQKGISFLDVPKTYYEDLKKRLPVVKEDIKELERTKILADGDEKTYLLQIFTKNAIGPIFFEIIERHGHPGFGEGNFQALFDAIERDQMERGYL